MRYSTESTVLPTTAPDLLEWAAAHVENLGLLRGRALYGTNTTTTRLATPSMVGAFDVASGGGRQSSGRTYDYPAVYAARRLALDVLSDLIAGGALAHDTDWDDEENQRRYVVQSWGAQDGRTRDEAAAMFREAARLSGWAGQARVQPGRVLHGARPRTADAVLELAAAHIEDVGHRPGMETRDPAGFTETAACTMLHALDRAMVAARPIPADGHEAWDAYRAAAPAALRLLVDHVTGGTLTPADGEHWCATRRRLRGTVLLWGNEPGRSTAEVAAAFRAAVPASVDEADELEELTEPGQVSFF